MSLNDHEGPEIFSIFSSKLAAAIWASSKTLTLSGATMTQHSRAKSKNQNLSASTSQTGDWSWLYSYVTLSMDMIVKLGMKNWALSSFFSIDK